MLSSASSFSRTLGVAVLAASLVACKGPRGKGAPGAPGRDTYLTGPGLAVDMLEAEIVDGTATVTVKIADQAGIPLDREGLFTEGAVSLSFILAHLARDTGGEPGQYVSYTTVLQTSPGGASATQAAAESGGVFEEVDIATGVYRYTFATPITVVDPSETHTVGVYGLRSFDGETFSDDAVFPFVPGGGPVIDAREIVDRQACGQCHDRLDAHGRSNESLQLCILCHQPQSTDPDSGNTVDFRVMIHKVHRGRDLPSVISGTPYQLVGADQTVHDYSTIGSPQPVALCVTCHPAALGSSWKTRPSDAACLSCHDDVVFAEPVGVGQQLHAGSSAPLTEPCGSVNCHGADSGASPIAPRHLVPAFDPARPEPVFAIKSIANTSPGEQPTITFTVSVLGLPRDITSSPLQLIRATFAGPNTDYATFWQASIQGPTQGSLVAVDAPNGVFAWTAAPGAAIPPTATGSYSVALEGFEQDPITSVRYAAVSVVTPFTVTGASTIARRTVVDRAHCNTCHAELAFHASIQKNPASCALCHNPNNVNDEGAPHFEAQSVYVHTVSFPALIHGIHMGEELARPYVLGRNPKPTASNPGGTPIDYGQVRFPSLASNCPLCHVGGSFELPLAEGLLPSFDEIRTCTEVEAADTDAFCSAGNFVVTSSLTMFPAAAACTGCHDAPDVRAHATVMTTPGGVESCATCHGPGAAFDVRVVHGLE